ncbi:MAG: DEAD/DEAH box helicase [Rhodoferax sp.]
MSLNLYAAQTDSVEPEAFQSGLIEGMTRALLRSPAPPCLLRAPTGSGKTFVISRVLEAVTAARPTLWLWFVPFINLVQQTEDALAANCTGLAPLMLAHGRNQELRSGQVLMSTAQGVAKARDRSTGYNADADDDMRTLAATIARARIQGLKIGLVVDEAHIGLDKTTEFGKFAQWLKADFLIMATATPKDERLLEFLQQAGMSAFESFSASRDEVVAARLNKRYIEAVVYDLRQSVQTVTDLKRTVLRQAWRRHQKLKRQLQAAGVSLMPLLLVQVANGDKTVEEAEKDLMTLCQVPPAAIGKHSSSDPDPVLMAAIANDASKEVLIFKQSAGTGFDAPRAFVLASTKPVNDPDFAMQFIGRVMRVSRAIRAAYPKTKEIPPELDTAYIYLADADAQRGFESAVSASGAVKSQLEGQTERLEVRQTTSGATVFTNRPTGRPIAYDLPLPDSSTPTLLLSEAARPAPGAQRSLFGQALTRTDDEPPDEVIRSIRTAAEAQATLPRTREQAVKQLETRGIRAYRCKTNLRNLPRALMRERRPELQRMANVSETAATRLLLPDELQNIAVQAALNRLKEDEIHTELTRGTRHEEKVAVITDRSALAREAQACLHSLPQVEEEDTRIIVDVLSRRLRARIDAAFEDTEEEQRPDETSLRRYARDAAHWVIRRQAEVLAELIQSLIAEFTALEEADPLPDVMLFPASLALQVSRRNIYGVMPPSDDDLAQLAQQLLPDERALLDDHVLELTDGEIRFGKYDGGLKLNGEERDFAKALDRAGFVEWWHRNPDRKHYAVRLVRGEHKNYFYPDFVVCLSHVDGEQPLPRLIETKENVKDAARKAQRVPKFYGKVLFLTKDQNRLRIVNDDGSLGGQLDADELSPLRTWMCKTAPAVY